MPNVELKHEKSGRTVVVDEDSAPFYTERGWAEDTSAADAAEAERAAKEAEEAAKAAEAEKEAEAAKAAEATKEAEGDSGTDSGEGDTPPVKTTKRGANTAS
ncbi:hypothetical protein [Arthrobacter agilis]|uniref:hypothetical protein n=1 Tax=Arthrobacter agilis TaxID=37921 RepID=UPI002781BB15|nr:hypothetical protein [Arthrobacter agilis]MDQ0735327.1 membrane protein involved in colicin uptake [Arthrobacter agilis]